MRIRTLAVLLLFFAMHRATAQAPFLTMDSLNVNKLVPTVLVHGDMWWNPQLQVAECHYPGSCAKSVNFAGALWMGGYDSSGNLYVAAQTYRQSGNDYWPGPLDSTGSLSYSTSSAWANIWKVNASDIQSFLSLSTHTTANTPASILTWPGKGNTYATGNGGVPLTITTDMAPFVDLNGDGIYEPLQGEYPDIKGDQALWWVFSDNGPTHNSSNGTPIQVEVHAMSYGYSRGTLIDNVVYYDYNIVNKSVHNYIDFRIGQWDDIDLGWYADDYIGFDSTWRMGIGYNGTNCDGCSAGHPLNSYGLDPPQAGLTMIILPGDSGTNYVPAGSFMYFNNDFSVVGNPTTDTQFNNYLRAENRIGVHMTSGCSAGGASCNYVFPGDPSDSLGWSECSCHDNPGDRRFVIASNDFNFNSGATQHIVFAMVVADSADGCPDASFSNIAVVADTAWYNYYNPPPSAVPNIVNNSTIKIYPNPAHDKMYIVNTAGNAGDVTITVYNTLGQVMPVPISISGQKDEVDVGLLPAAVYYLQYRNGNELMTAKFVKE